MKFRTKNTTYTLTDMGDGAFLIEGHQKYCPSQTPCRLLGPVEVGKCVNFNTYSGSPSSKWVQTTPVVEIIED